MAPRTRHPLLALGCAALLAGCTLGPDYLRPEMPLPAQYRADEGSPEAASIADEGWWAFTTDPVLKQLIRDAIAGNPELRSAAQRVLEARATYGIARSYLFPELGASAGYTAQRESMLTDPPRPAGTDRGFENWNAGLAVSWELDFFGRIRRDSEAAFASYLATEQGYRATQLSLVADVASTYILLRELDAQLAIARKTVVINEETVAYYRKRLQGGLSNRLEVDTAVANRARTAVLIPQLELQIAQAENALSILLGRMPGPVARGVALQDMETPTGLSPGLPASLLERRPDVLAAEQQLVAANAQVGAAKALFFPSISLTGLLGSVSGELGDLMESDSELRQANASLFAPVFQAGRLRRNLEAQQARYEQAFSAYRGAALNGYREVANALTAIGKLRAIRGELEQSVVALEDGAALARSRYDQGLSSYLEILNADQLLLDQRLQLAATRGQELRTLVDLYRALGGGWQQEPAAP